LICCLYLAIGVLSGSLGAQSAGVCGNLDIV
jgi:hypothetical protein